MKNYLEHWLAMIYMTHASSFSGYYLFIYFTGNTFMYLFVSLLFKNTFVFFLFLKKEFEKINHSIVLLMKQNKPNISTEKRLPEYDSIISLLLKKMPVTLCCLLQKSKCFQHSIQRPPQSLPNQHDRKHKKFWKSES